MIHGGFLDPESRKDLIELARDGSAARRLARRANVLALLDNARHHHAKLEQPKMVQQWLAQLGCRIKRHFLRVEAPRKWRDYCDEASDNFRIIDPKDFRALG